MPVITSDLIVVIMIIIVNTIDYIEIVIIIVIVINIVVVIDTVGRVGFLWAGATTGTISINYNCIAAHSQYHQCLKATTSTQTRNTSINRTINI